MERPLDYENVQNSNRNNQEYYNQNSGSVQQNYQDNQYQAQVDNSNKHEYAKENKNTGNNSYDAGAFDDVVNNVNSSHSNLQYESLGSLSNLKPESNTHNKYLSNRDAPEDYSSESNYAYQQDQASKLRLEQQSKNRNKISDLTPENSDNNYNDDEIEEEIIVDAEDSYEKSKKVS